MADIISQRHTYITVAKDDGLYPATDLYPAENLYPKDAGTVDITNIVSGTLKLDTLIAENVPQFGRIFASKFECTAYLTGSIKNYKIQVSQVDGANYKILFTGFIDSCKQDGTGLDRKIVAYDYAKRLKEINAATWWEWFWKNRTTATLKQCRDSFLDYIEIAYHDVELPNDSLIVRKSVDLTNCTADNMLQMMCEINYCFPHFNGIGELEFLMLDTDFYGTTPINLTGRYEWTKSAFEEYKTNHITGIQFYDSGNELKYTYPDTSSSYTKNAYPMRKNIFLYEATQHDLEQIGLTFLQIFDEFSYTPSTVKMITSDLSIQLGDKIHTEKGDFYVLQNTFSGVQLFEQTLKCRGVQELYGGKPNFNYNEIILGEKLARVKQDVDEFSIEYANFRDGTNAKFQLTSEQISTEVSKRTAQGEQFTSQIKQTAEQIKSEVEARKAGDTTLSSQITQTASSIKTSVSQQIGGVTQKISTLTQTVDGFKTTVKDLSDTSKTHTSQIEQTAKDIKTKVSYSDENYKKISSIEQTANGVKSTVDALTKPNTGTLAKMQSSIEQTAKDITTKVSYSDENYKKISKIEQTANGVQSTVTELTKKDGRLATMESSIKQNADSIKTKVSNNDPNYKKISTIEQNLLGITLSVENGSNSSTIKLSGNGIKAQSKEIKFTGDVLFANRLTDKKTKISGDNILTGKILGDYIDANTVKAKMANITGNLTADRIVGNQLLINSSKVKGIVVGSSNTVQASLDETDGLVVGKSNIKTQLNSNGLFIGKSVGTPQIQISTNTNGPYIKMSKEGYSSTSNYLLLKSNSLTINTISNGTTTIKNNGITTEGNITANGKTSIITTPTLSTTTLIIDEYNYPAASVKVVDGSLVGITSYSLNSTNLWAVELTGSTAPKVKLVNGIWGFVGEPKFKKITLESSTSKTYFSIKGSLVSKTVPVKGKKVT